MTVNEACMIIDEALILMPESEQDECSKRLCELYEALSFASLEDYGNE